MAVRASGWLRYVIVALGVILLVTSAGACGESKPQPRASASTTASPELPAPVGSIPLPDDPTHITVDSKTHRVYVSRADGDYLAVVDGLSLKPLPPVTHVSDGAIVVDVALGRLFAPDADGKGLRIIDTSNGALIAKIDLPTGDHTAIGLDSQKHRVYVATSSEGPTYVTAIDGKTGKALKQIRTPLAPAALAVGRTGDVYVAMTDLGKTPDPLWVLDDNLTILRKLQISSGPPQLVVTSVISTPGQLLYVTLADNQSENGLLIEIDPRSGKTIRRLELPSPPGTIGMTPRGDTLMILNTGVEAHTAWIVKTERLLVASTVDVSSRPADVAIDATTGRAYVIAGPSGVMTVFET